MKYKLILNEKQMRAVKSALELRFRIDLLQEMDLAEILAFINVPENAFDLKNPKRSENFNRYLDRRDHIREVLVAAFNIACPMSKRMMGEWERNQSALICEDVWQKMRYELAQDDPDNDKSLYYVYNRKPLSVSEEGIPEIERVIDDE